MSLPLMPALVAVPDSDCAVIVKVPPSTAPIRLSSNSLTEHDTNKNAASKALIIKKIFLILLSSVLFPITVVIDVVAHGVLFCTAAYAYDGLSPDLHGLHAWSLVDSLVVHLHIKIVNKAPVPQDTGAFYRM